MSNNIISWSDYQAKKGEYILHNSVNEAISSIVYSKPEVNLEVIKIPFNAASNDSVLLNNDIYVSSVPKKEHKFYNFDRDTKNVVSMDNYDSAKFKNASHSNSTVNTLVKTATYSRCCATHNPLKIVVGEKSYFIYGGSCSDPVVKDADIYVGFELGMKSSPKAYPWSGGASFTFHIQDSSVPTSLEDTKQLLKYLSDNLIAGKKVHVGCIGGHGRTGTILAALVMYMTGNTDAIEYVRKNYCEKAVESVTQVNWLNTHFGIEKAKPSKSYNADTFGTTNYGFRSKSVGVSKNYSDIYSGSNEVPSEGYTLYESVKPVKVKGSIWGF